ncbi:WPP domain-interacting protein 3 [Cardamine amara subsp. amara]|uniref:WPP domain-interacting protein 3 n=1 Tax=Cardamine amara subsp. amara TaxID=228776 RepID=A0ABD1ADZ6_CARAN
MNDSVPESVEDNGNSIMNHRSSSSNAESMENVSVNGLLVLPNDDHEEGIGSPQQWNNVDSLIKVESPGGSVHSTRKGFGLKKWRRIKRDGPVKDEATPIDDGSKLLKRGLTGLVNPPSKHVDLSSVEARQSSEGSVGSVNMVQHHPGIANGFSPPDLGCMFTVGQTFEKSEEHSGNSIGAKSVGGKIVSGTIKKGSEERVEIKKEKPCSSLDSDLRSSDFVFSSGAVSVGNHGEKDERLMMMNHIGGFSKDAQVREEVQTYNRSGNGNKEENGDESKQNYSHWVDKDPFADSIRSFATLQEALWKEVQSFQELGKESIPLHSNTDELSSSDQSRNESCREEDSTSSRSKVLILKQKVKHLEHKLEEARAVLEAKETKIQELENSKSESELEVIFQRRVEAEIEHLLLTKSLNSSLQVLKQPKKVNSLTEDPESNRGDILGKTCTLGFYILTQLILLVSILRFLILQFSPASRLVIPT